MPAGTAYSMYVKSCCCCPASRQGSRWATSSTSLPGVDDCAFLAVRMIKLRWHLRCWLVKTAIWLLKLSGWHDGYWSQGRGMFQYAEANGLHIMPVHYYSPIPDTRELQERLWQGARFPVGFDLKIDAALERLCRLGEKYGGEFSNFPRSAGNN